MIIFKDVKKIIKIKKVLGNSQISLKDIVLIDKNKIRKNTFKEKMIKNHEKTDKLIDNEIENYISSLKNPGKKKEINKSIIQESLGIKYIKSNYYAGFILVNTKTTKNSNINITNILLKDSKIIPIIKKPSNFDLLIHLKKNYKLRFEMIKNIDELKLEENIDIYIVQITNINNISDGIFNYNLTPNQNKRLFAWRPFIEIYDRKSKYLYNSILKNENLHLNTEFYLDLDIKCNKLLLEMKHKKIDVRLCVFIFGSNIF